MPPKRPPGSIRVPNVQKHLLVGGDTVGESEIISGSSEDGQSANRQFTAMMHTPNATAAVTNSLAIFHIMLQWTAIPVCFDADNFGDVFEYASNIPDGLVKSVAAACAPFTSVAE